MSPDAPTTSSEAHKRFRTLQITASLSVDTAAMSRISAREAEVGNAGGGRPVRLVGPAKGRGARGSGDGWHRQTWRIRWMPPTLWREELTSPGGQIVVTVVRPDVSQSYISAHSTLYTSEPAPPRGRLAELAGRLFDRAPEGAWPPDVAHNATIDERLAEFPLINPRLPASEWELTSLGEESQLGRVVRRVRATRRRGSAAVRESERSGYWPSLNEYEYLVDDALEILVRVTGLENGKAVAIVSADEVLVDAPLPADVFSFTPPAGTRVTHVQRRT